MKVSKINSTSINIKRGEVFFNTSILFSLLVPIIFLIYIGFQVNLYNVDINTIIFNHPENAVLFILAMIQPFYGYIIKESIKNIKDNLYISLSQLQIYIIAFCQLIVGNLLGFIPIVIGIYKSNNKYKLSKVLKESLAEINTNKTKFILLMIMFILFISIFCSIFKFKLL